MASPSILSRPAGLAAALAMALTLTACPAKRAQDQASQKAPTKGAVTLISGAGATFPYPIYAKWAEAYAKKTGVKLNYQSIGSGGGIKQIEAKTVDFGASDAPLQPDDLKKNGLVQWPMIIGGVVPVVNIPGIKPGELKLPPEVLADIYLGEIKSWDDPGSPRPTRASSSPARPSASSTAPTARAPPGSSPTTSRR